MDIIIKTSQKPSLITTTGNCCSGVSIGGKGKN